MGSVADNCVFDLQFGGAGYILSVTIRNESDRVVWLHEIRLEYPWDELQFRWLEYPVSKRPREYTYDFRLYEPISFAPETVLNHRIGRKGKLLPGDDFEGLLLGIGQSPIPNAYSNRQSIQSRLSIFDERATRYDLDVRLIVNRNQPVKSTRVKTEQAREKKVAV